MTEKKRRAYSLPVLNILLTPFPFFARRRSGDVHPSARPSSLA